jgi:hypothetical protein
MAIPDQIPIRRSLPPGVGDPTPPVLAAPPSAPALQPGEDPESPIGVANALLRATRQCAEKAAMGNAAAESKDFAQAALAAAQAFVVLDPAADASGVPLTHQLTLERERGQIAIEQERIRGENALKQAQERAAAPTPRKSKTVNVRRDEQGRPAAYRLEEE